MAKRRPPTLFESATSAAFGGICNVIAGQPFDTIKVRLQTESSTKVFRGPFDCFLRTVSDEGFFALYKGTSGAFVSIMVENVVLLTANTGIKRALKNIRKDDSPLTLGEKALCGGVAGIFSAVAITPAEVIKCRLQVSRNNTVALATPNISGSSVSHSRCVSLECSRPPRYAGPIDCLLQTIRKEGYGGLFRGLSSVLVRDLPFNFMFLGSYEAVIHCLVGLRGSNASKDTLSSLEILTAGGIAGVVGWAVVFPIDVVKSRMQTSHRKDPSMVRVFRKIWLTDGPFAFYRGVSAALLRAFPANAGLFLGYEMAQRKLFHRLDHEVTELD
ncbi:hypothetical protein AAMO2058_000023000 [Amorphochlora amoebiformis]